MLLQMTSYVKVVDLGYVLKFRCIGSGLIFLCLDWVLLLRNFCRIMRIFILLKATADTGSPFLIFWNGQGTRCGGHRCVLPKSGEQCVVQYVHTNSISRLSVSGLSDSCKKSLRKGQLLSLQSPSFIIVRIVALQHFFEQNDSNVFLAFAILVLA